MKCDTGSKVSVVIPCYNHGEHLAEAVESAISQTKPPLEVIVVDDGSNDRATLKALKAIAGSGVKIIQTCNNGLAAARNNGIRAAKGDFILPLDADDKIAPCFLEQASAVLAGDPQIGIVYGKVELIGERSGVWHKPLFSEELLLFENMIVACAMFRRKDWETVGGYCEKMVYGWEDWEFWLSLVEMGFSAFCFPEIVFFYRIGKSSMTGKMRFLQKVSMARLLIWRHRRLYVKNFPYCFYRLLHPSMRKVPSPR